MKTKELEKLVFIADDDPSHNILMNHLLKKFGLTSESYTTYEELSKRLETQLPALFMIDLNLESLKNGYELINYIRTNVSTIIPILVVSSNKDTTKIAHAMELGASDYLYKPLNRDLLITKLASYFSSSELIQALQTSAKMPDGAIRVTAQLDIQLEQIDETGVTVVCKHLIPKGTALALSGKPFDEILGQGARLMVTALSVSSGSQDGVFKTYLEFDSTSEVAANKIRTWLVGKARPPSN